MSELRLARERRYRRRPCNVERDEEALDVCIHEKHATSLAKPRTMASFERRMIRLHNIKSIGGRNSNGRSKAPQAVSRLESSAEEDDDEEGAHASDKDTGRKFNSATRILSAKNIGDGGESRQGTRSLMSGLCVACCIVIPRYSR